MTLLANGDGALEELQRHLPQMDNIHIILLANGDGALQSYLFVSLSDIKSKRLLTLYNMNN